MFKNCKRASMLERWWVSPDKNSLLIMYKHEFEERLKEAEKQFGNLIMDYKP